MDNKLLQSLDDALAHDIPKLMSRFSASSPTAISIPSGLGIDQIAEILWEWDISEDDFRKNQELFKTLSPKDGFADKGKTQQVGSAWHGSFT